MPDTTAPEASMDEILASIRRIVSEDEAPAAPDAKAGDSDVLELTDKVPETPAGKPPVAKNDAASVGRPDEALTGDAAASATAASFETLKSAADSDAKARATMALPPPGRSLEDVTRELLRPLLKAWLDEHLPTIVQASVEEEVARIARGRVR
ncbi:MAG: DUF2497 domain-containing protein [Pseudomonadota bacterium]|nr:DUF2497 domain-containing protein [Pseudomonadota bacterium]